MRDRLGRPERSRGATLVEFALIAPLLFLLLFGIIEFGWAFLQYLDVRHGAREGARLAAVNYQEATETGTAQSDKIIDETCGRMDTASGSTITVTLPVSDPADPASAPVTDIGAKARVEVSTNLDTLTGFLDNFLGGVILESDVDIRLEQDASWATRSKTCA